MNNRLKFIITIYIILISTLGFSQSLPRNSDQWSATDALGRKLPTVNEARSVKTDKFIGIFYWTWHEGHLAANEAGNFTKILTQYPESANDANHFAWGTNLEYWWDEPLFGYYRTTDRWVLRKHAEMLADAGVDAVFFDCTNGSWTWKASYMELCEVWHQARLDGVNTPKIAFLMPFAAIDDATESISEVYTDLYKPELYKDLWFMWNGKPLIMAYPEMKSTSTATAGMKFNANSVFTSVSATCPSWGNSIGNLTMKLYRWDTSYAKSVAVTPIASQTFVDFTDNAMLSLNFSSQPAGDYLWELSSATEQVGVWKWTDSTDPVISYFSGTAVAGNYDSQIMYPPSTTYTNLTNGTTRTPVEIPGGKSFSTQYLDSIRAFFTFRPGQPIYVYGPSRNDHWGWLEIYPQHGYVAKQGGGFEQVTVGVAQNASLATGGLATPFNMPGTFGRSYTNAKGQDNSQEAYFQGKNFQEQWSRAFELDPDLVWVTGWNEWKASKINQSAGSNPPFHAWDAYTAEKSRDLEPVKSWGNKGDVYYNQFVSNVRRFKGMSPADTASVPKTINITDNADWGDVKPAYKAYRGNTLHRSAEGQGSLFYTNNSGRNDIVGAKVARDDNYVYFMVQTDAILTPKTNSKWMRLFIDIDRDKSTGWEGYDFIVNRTSPADSATVEKSTNSWSWSSVGKAEYSVNDNVLVLKIRRSVLGVQEVGLNFEFKWSDNMQEDGNIMDFYVNGDAAPGGRFNYVYQIKRTNDGYLIAELPVGLNHGLLSQRYDGVFDTIPDFSRLIITATEYPTSFVLPTASSADYALVQTGFINIPEKDIYTFSLNTDLSAKFYIGNQVVVESTEHSGIQTGIIKLMPGKHAVRLEYVTKAANSKLLDLKMQSLTQAIAPIQAQYIYKYNIAPLAALSFHRIQNYYTMADSVVVVNATDPDGSVSKVEIYDNDQLVGNTLNTAEFALNNFTGGNHAIFIKVYDNDGAITNSNLLNFTVKDSNFVPGSINIDDYINSLKVKAVNSTDTDGGNDYRLAYGWIEYPINVTIAGVYRINFRVPKSINSNKLTVKSNSEVLGTVELANSAATTDYYDVPVDVNLNAGVQILRIEANNRLSIIHRIEISRVTSVTNLTNSMTVEIYPNPSFVDFIVKLDDDKATICIYDILGKMVEYSTNVNRYERRVGAKLSPGVYILDVTSSNGIKQQYKIVKQ